MLEAVTKIGRTRELDKEVRRETNATFEWWNLDDPLWDYLTGGGTEAWRATLGIEVARWLRQGVLAEIPWRI